MTYPKICTECGKGALRKGLCSKHYSASYRKLHPSYHKDYKAEWRRKNPEGRKLERESYKKWAARNKEKLRVLSAKWRKKNHEYVLAKAKEYNNKNKAKYKVWRKENRDLLRVHERKKRLKRSSAHGWHTAKEVAKLWWRQRGKCAVCNISIWDKYHEDHMTPLARGGSDHIHNIQLLCPPCNQIKHAKDPIKFMQSLGFLI